jgi:hypothetical protein
MHRTEEKPPKRVVSKYLYFCQDERLKIMAENPSLSIRECTCELGRRWKDFQESDTTEDRERMNRYQILFDADKKRYDDAKANQPQRSVETRKKPTSAYLNFCADQRSTNPKISLKELSVKWAEIKLDHQRIDTLKTTQ